MSGAPRQPRAGRWPLLPIAPAIVTLVGLLTATLIAVVSAQQLQAISDSEAALRSSALAATLAARIHSVSPDQRAPLMAAAANDSDSAFLLVDRGGTVLARQRLAGIPPHDVRRLLSAAEGTTETGGGRMCYAAAAVGPPLDRLSVVAFVQAPSPAEGTLDMIKAIFGLTLLLVAMAIIVALLFMRAARDDVVYVRRRIADMARGVHADAGALGTDRVPIRSLDQVGLVTAALNNLVERFAAAERTYRADLRRAAQLDNERSQFLAGLSHELRTPLNAILGFTHLLESEDEPLSEDAQEAVAMIGTSGELLKVLIDDILDLSAMETGQLRLQRQMVDISQLAREVCKQAQATISSDKVTLKVDELPGVLAWADPRRVKQILNNLISNALKATTRGHVQVTVSKQDDSAVVTVSDTGHGMTAQVLQRIFEPYEQAGDANARRGGAGLGLAITKRLVLLHGGGLDASSEVGKGSIFRFTLPDETHAAVLPRDSLVPWSDTDPIGFTIPSSKSRQPRSK